MDDLISRQAAIDALDKRFDSIPMILEQTKGSLIISDAFTKADSVLNHKGYKNIACSVRGGADNRDFVITKRFERFAIRTASTEVDSAEQWEASRGIWNIYRNGI